MKKYFLFQLVFLISALALFAEPIDRVETWSLTPEKVVEIAYDFSGNKASWKDWTGETLYTYDHYKYLSSVKSPLGEETFYKHDPLGRLKKITYPSKKEVSYTHFPGGKIKEVSFQGRLISYSYDPDTSLLLKKTVRKGVSTEYEYDEARRVSDIIHRDSKNHLIAHFHFEYDAMDNPVLIRKTLQDEETVTQYIYDKLYRLIEESSSDGHFEKYSYDALGNRLTKDSSKENLTYQYSEEGHLKQAGDISYEYNKKGYLIKKTSPLEEVFYSYNELGQLTAYKDEKS